MATARESLDRHADVARVGAPSPDSVRADVPSPDNDAWATAAAAIPRHIFSHANPPTHFATLFASNAAAISSLALVKLTAEPTAYLSNCLIENTKGIGYHLDLSQPPKAVLSWRVGLPWTQQTTESTGYSGVDFILCSRASPSGFRRARGSMAFGQATISLHPESGVLMLRNFSKTPIIYKNGYGSYDREISRGDGDGPSCVLFQQENRLVLGEFEFVLAMNLPSRPAHRESFIQRRNAMILEGGGHPHDSNVLPLPAVAPEIIGDVGVHKNITEHWSHGVCLQSGQPLALLQQTCDSKSQYRVQEFVEILGRLEGAPGVCSPVIRFCEHGHWPPCQLTVTHFGTWKERVYIAFPLPAFTFRNMPWQRIPIQHRERYCYQTLIGLDNIHKHGIVHSNIRPESLQLLPDEAARQHVDASSIRHSFELPMKAVHSNFLWPKNMRAATSHQTEIAPELWGNTDESPHTVKSDIWSLAISWMWAFTSVNMPIVEHCEEGEFTAIRERLLQMFKQRQITGGLRRILLNMLRRDPCKRPDTQSLLQESYWAEPHFEETHGADTSTICSPLSPQRRKKVRLQTPEEGM